MEVKENVVAAISAALQFYMQAEQEAAMAAMPAARQGMPEGPRPAYSPWAMAGRQASMEMRRMWQMRLVR